MGDAKRRKEAASDQLKRVPRIASQGAERTSGLLDMAGADIAPKLRAELVARLVYYRAVLECEPASGAASVATEALQRILQIKPPATPILDALDAEIN